MIYFLDTSSILQARNFYPGEIFAGLWEWLEVKSKNGEVASVEAVLGEIHDADILDWLDKARFRFHPESREHRRHWKRVQAWLKGSGYNLSSLLLFADVADAKLVAHAGAVGGTVVTEEKQNPVPQKNQATRLPKIKIPNACDGLGIGCTNLLGMLKAENVRFELASGPD